MTLHKLAAGSGYTYLTRHVASQDGPAVGYENLGAYYSERGEAPGVWLGRGLAGLGDGPMPGDRVGEEQMVALFGHGHHPDRPGTALGVSFTTRAAGAAGFGRELARRIGERNTAEGLPAVRPLDAVVLAELRGEVAGELFADRHGRAPDARELADFLIAVSRRGTGSVAGYDLTFSPVKSVSTFWALAAPEVATEVEAAHTAAVQDVVGWLEDTATYTRLGRNGVRQVDTRGLLAVAFVHRDSRAGDPDLHTHVAISNKVQTLDGRWRALDGRVLHQAAVAASERYNTRLEAHLVDRLGVRFVDRATGRGKRPVREIEGVSPHLLTVWSSRRLGICARHAQLAAEFTRRHGRAPDAGETHDLFGKANLMTRPSKHEPRSLAEQRAAWRTAATDLLGRPAVDAMLTAVASPERARVAGPVDLYPWVERAGRQAIATVSAGRATWQAHHIRAEVERLARTDAIPLIDVEIAVQVAVDVALSPTVSVPLGGDDDGIEEPAILRRRDGSSVFTVAGSQLYTSSAILAAEQRLLAAAARTDGRVVPDGLVELTVLEARVTRQTLNPGQEQLVRDLATSGRRVQVALAAAGTGKTTALGALADAWREDGGTVIGVAPSAAAAAELRAALQAPTDTIAKLLHGLDTGTLTPDLAMIGPDTLLVVDEAGMVGTLDLDQVVQHVIERGGSVRLVGDTRQLAAVAAGGVLRDITRTHPTATLDTPVRFTDPVEGHASLALRVGDPIALGYYLDHHRIHAGDRATTIDAAFTAWQADRDAGLDAVMLAATNTTVRELNTRARTHRLTGQDAAAEVGLHDGTRAGAGDLIVTRRNNRKLPITATDWVKNGDRWQIQDVTGDGSIRARHLATRRSIVLPAAYVREHVELGYATTIHLAQGRTVDTSHTVLTGRESRTDLYVAMTRGRHANHAYLDTTTPDDPTSPTAVRAPTSTEALEAILARDPDQRSATSQRHADLDPATRLRHAADRYIEAVTVAAGHPGSGPGPLPWLPPVPDTDDPAWTDYLHRRRDHVTHTAERITADMLPDEPWARAIRSVDLPLARDLAIWRAATGRAPDDPTPCGSPGDESPTYRHDLDQRARAAVSLEHFPARRWRPLVTELDPRVTSDPHWPWLARAINQAARSGYDIPTRLPALLQAGNPLPDEHPAQALLYRLATDWPQALGPGAAVPSPLRDDDEVDRRWLGVEAAQQQLRAERTPGFYR